LGHPDDGRYPIDYPTLVRAAGERGVLLEVNNTSLTPGCFRKDGPIHCTQMLRECKKLGVSIVVGSDAHFASAVGAHQYAQALLEELDFPAELVLNTDPQRFKAFIQKKMQKN
jgi:putative hydrolase